MNQLPIAIHKLDTALVQQLRQRQDLLTHYRYLAQLIEADMNAILAANVPLDNQPWTVDLERGVIELYEPPNAHDHQ